MRRRSADDAGYGVALFSILHGRALVVKSEWAEQSDVRWDVWILRGVRGVFHSLFRGSSS